MRWLAADKHLDQIKFGVLFSSQAAWLPMAGQGVYAAANASLDAFADDQHRFSVAWGAFASRGMYEKMDERQRKAERALWRPLNEMEIGPVLENVDRSCGVFDVKWDALPGPNKTVYSSMKRIRGSERKVTDTVMTSDVDVEGIVREVLGMERTEELDATAAFKDLGFDSMLSVELASRLREASGGAVVVGVEAVAATAWHAREG